MNETPFLVTRSTFTKAILSGHIVNIIVGIIVFTGVHYGLHQVIPVAIIITIFSTTVGAILSSLIATKRLSAPVHALNSELVKLHEKVNASTSALTQMSSETQAMLNELPAGVITFDSNNNLTRINDTAKRQLFLVEPSQETEAPELNAAIVMERIKQLVSDGKTIDFTDWLHESKTNKIQDVKFWPMATLRQNNQVGAYDFLARYNKSDTNGCEVTLMLVDRERDFAKQEKQMEFISLAAHELRGPITVMRGIIDVFKNEVSQDLDADHQNLLLRMGVSSRQLAGYVDNILNVSRIEKETFEIRQKESDWQSVITQVTEDLSLRAETHHRKLRFNIAQNLPTVAIDDVAMSHVITNLVDNAIKYSKENGEIVVSTVLKGDEIETTVQDFGIGIPANVVDNLFTKFYRSQQGRQVATGTGLGLYLCKNIVEAHGGTIWVRSSEGKGTTFGFTVPTYASVAKSLKNGDNQENGIVRGNHGWIKNHALFRR
jgi:signal transduction histidine kinase